MMRRYSYQQEVDSPDMTPMLDVVFILLIFFIVSSSFIKENAIDWSTGSDGSPSQDIPLVVAIDSSGEFSINGRSIDIEALRANAEMARSQGKFVAAIVKSHPLAASGQVVKAVDDLRSAGFAQVSVARW